MTVVILWCELVGTNIMFLCACICGIVKHANAKIADIGVSGVVGI